MFYTDSLYILMFGSGFLGGFGHCIGMCGPLVASYALYPQNSDNKRRTAILSHILYNTGRVTTYSFIGAFMGFTGSFVNASAGITGVQNFAAIFAGIIMVIMGLGVLGVFKGMKFIERHNGAVMKAIKAVLESESAWRYYPFGILMGFLPCGLSYSAFIAAAGTSDLLKGMAISVCFGLGTIPALLLFGFAVKRVGVKFREKIYKAGGVTIMLVGLYFIWKSIAVNA
jgi:sulfite exporter TauE/SafE